MRRYSQYICGTFCIALPGLAFAGAWTQDQGSAQLITTLSYYNTSNYWDTKGNSHTEPTYQGYTLNPYIEYGLRDDITIGANLSLDLLQQNVTGGGVYSYGLGDSEFFMRKRVWNDSGFVVSLEPMIKLPSPESQSLQPPIGSSNVDVGLSVLSGYGFDAFGLHHYVDVDTQYRHRFGAPTDQVRISGTLGIAVTPKWTIMPQTFMTYRTSSPSNAAFNQSASDDYNVVRLQLSAVYALTSSTNIQVGGFSDVTGKNAGEGNGALVALWVHL